MSLFFSPFLPFFPSPFGILYEYHYRNLTNYQSKLQQNHTQYIVKNYILYYAQYFTKRFNKEIYNNNKQIETPFISQKHISFANTISFRILFFQEEKNKTNLLLAGPEVYPLSFPLAPIHTGRHLRRNSLGSKSIQIKQANLGEF